MAALLIAEDNIDANEAVCEYLQEAGHCTISAFDGEEAIILFSEHKIDLVILNIMLLKITEYKFIPSQMINGMSFQISF